MINKIRIFIDAEEINKDELLEVLKPFGKVSYLTIKEVAETPKNKKNSVKED
jgi:hypothetical protein